MRRFYTPDILQRLGPGGEIRLPPGEAHHLQHVIRLKPGDLFEAFDGTGWSVAARVERIGRREVEATLAAPPAHQPPDPLQLTLAVATPKPDRLRWLVEKGVELGVARLVPLVTQRSAPPPGANALRKLEEAGIQACKQCGRNTLMTIHEPLAWERFLVEAAEDGAARVVFGDPRGAPLAFPGAAAHPVVGGDWRVMIGPEGGLTESEIALAVQHGASGASWGRYVLRIETAAIAAAAVIRSHVCDPARPVVALDLATRSSDDD